MLWSVLFGWVFFHSLPDAQGWLGIVMIVGAGLYVLYREGSEGLAELSPADTRGWIA